MSELMDPSRASFETDGGPRFQFCALQYQQRNWEIGSSGIAPVILLVLCDSGGDLRFLVHPELRTIVQGEDLVYIQSLLQDFLLRSRREPPALFKQLSTLGVGPLVTREVGSQLEEGPFLRGMSSIFVEFK